ncbi:hypothetical protein N9917_00505 [Deltaproteobacteria bacterium]|nr:hypothetical protein [Deltaproteobacteria bacterium]
MATPNAERLLGTTPAPGGRWKAQGHINGTTRYLGTYDSQDEAHTAFMEAKRQASSKPEEATFSVAPTVGRCLRYVGRRASLRGAWVEVVGVRTSGKVYVSPIGTDKRHLVHRSYLRLAPFDVGDEVLYENGRGKGAALNGLVFTVIGFSDGGKKVEVVDASNNPRTLDPKFLSNTSLDDEAVLNSQHIIRDMITEWKGQPNRPERRRALKVAEQALGILVAARKTTP